jgi:CPA1 family monovalent cation:H+ antiporter
LLAALRLLFPNLTIFHEATRLLREIDFSQALLNWLLAFLLFAGALHVDVSRLRDRKWIIGAMATLGLIISTVIVATGFWIVAAWLGVPIPFAWALVFGALISPTDPVAVLSVLKEVKVREALEMDMSGESLFNDGVGVALFTILVAAAANEGTGFGFTRFGELLLVEVIGGGVLGLMTGYLAYRAMRLIDDFSIEVLISLALVTGTYALALNLHVSGPIAVVTAGILIGNRGAAVAMSEITRRYLFGFWTLVDEILNSVLFLLIGLEVLFLQFDLGLVPLALAAIPIVVIARFFAVSIPVLALSPRTRFEPGTIPVLTWGGVRGGISIALALSISNITHKPALLAATYAVVVFTVIVQGLSLPWVVKIVGVQGQAEADGHRDKM